MLMLHSSKLNKVNLRDYCHLARARMAGSGSSDSDRVDQALQKFLKGSHEIALKSVSQLVSRFTFAATGHWLSKEVMNFTLI
eukprot:m.240291 g.240291  ORF g.240291 m.240291 type:complete len:82 (-) comp15305_c0_seq8:224-469(-)